jgi:hypothetical protein
MSMSNQELNLWTSGLFEVAGTFFFRKSAAAKNSHLPFNYYPKITYMDNDSKRLLELQQRLGGKIKDERVWHVTGEGAVAVAEKMRGTSPLRDTIVRAFLGWNEQPSITAATEYVIELLSGTEKQTEISKKKGLTSKNYLNLATQAAFMGGVIDTRGSFYILEEDEPHLNIISQNKPLLDAVHTVWGGSEPNYQEGNYEGYSYYWQISRRQLFIFLESVAPHIILRNFEELDILLQKSYIFKIPETPAEIIASFTPMEKKFYDLLDQHQGYPLSVEKIIHFLWNDDPKKKGSNVNDLITKVNQKIEPRLGRITRVPGQGYVLNKTNL